MREPSDRIHKSENLIYITDLSFSTDVCDVEAMLNHYVNEDVTTSESESENELANIPGQSSSELAQQIPSVFVENSSDIHIGPRLQYNGPVTVKQYITVNGKNSIKSSPGELCNDIANTGVEPPEVVITNSMYTRVVKTFFLSSPNLRL
jgi:hypothetical protein